MCARGPTHSLHERLTLCWDCTLLVPWQNRFFQTDEQSSTMHHQAFLSTLAAALEDMPEHCLRCDASMTCHTSCMLGSNPGNLAVQHVNIINISQLIAVRCVALESFRGWHGGCLVRRCWQAMQHSQWACMQLQHQKQTRQRCGPQRLKMGFKWAWIQATREKVGENVETFGNADSCQLEASHVYTAVISSFSCKNIILTQAGHRCSWQQCTCRRKAPPSRAHPCPCNYSSEWRR
eukprot:353839-Chlamydomonas_euryale.AAC.16